MQAFAIKNSVNIFWPDNFCADIHYRTLYPPLTDEKET